MKKQERFPFPQMGYWHSMLVRHRGDAIAWQLFGLAEARVEGLMRAGQVS